MRLTNTFTRALDELPAPPGPIRMYVCGPTVYDRAHIGNARPFVIAMWLRAWLRERGYDVNLVHNITDVNDKIYDAAPGHSAERAREATRWYLEDTGALGLGQPDHLPLATEYVPQIVAFIEGLIESGNAYAAGGDVYFRVASFPDYGRLSGQRPDQVEADEDTSPLKEDPRDFALWKATKPGEDTSWESPWGMGRPGWHIECSVMAEELLGPAFEIHGGGLDLVFPHHENELAQSRAHGSEFARLWMHNGLLRPVSGDKMSKSLGNFTTIHDALEQWGRETILLFFMTARWSKPIDFSNETMAQAAAFAETLRNGFRLPSEPAPEGAWDRLVEALEDDFNTTQVLPLLAEWRDHDLVRRALAIFGLESLAESQDAPGEVVALAERRGAAREAGDYAEADRLRAEIEAADWEVRDVAESPGFQLVPRR